MNIRMVNYLLRCFIIIRFLSLSPALYSQNRYTAVFTAPPKMVPSQKTPDGPLAGNGDIGLTVGGAPDRLNFYIGKNDFWRAYPVYPGGGIALPGALSVSVDALAGASYHAEQVMDSAFINGMFSKDDLTVNMKAWVTATHNTVVITFTSNKPCKARLSLWCPEGNTAVTTSGETNKVWWVTRSFSNSPLLEWPCHVVLAMKMFGAASSPDHIVELLPGQTVTFAITVYTQFDRSNWKEAAINEAASLSTATIHRMKQEHEQWWSQYWKQSAVSIGNDYLEKYYTASQYLIACASRKGKFAPGIWGPFITRDSTAWGGDYHLNYNYQAPYWAAYSSNHIDLTDNYDQPLLDYMQKGKQHAKQLLHIRGIYYPVGIGPKGLVTTHWPLTPDDMEKRYGTRENNIDSGYKFLGQKINAVFGAANMLMRFYSTYDKAYAERVYPYMIECANFWEDYLKWENGRYVIYMDHFNEVMPRLNNTGDWRKGLGDVNSTLSLGLVTMLFKGMLDMSVFLRHDAKRRNKWQHILTHLSHFPVGETEGRKSLKNVERNASGEPRAAGLNRVSIHGLILPGAITGPVTDSAFNDMLLNDVSHWKEKMRGVGGWGNTLGNGVETCFPGAVRVGYNPDEILQYLSDRIKAQSLPNLWITQEGGGVETLAAVPLTIHEMLLQSYEGVIRIFPNWNRHKDASFHGLRAYGAFLVSSELRSGNITSVELLSEQGRICHIENPWPGKKVQLTRNGVKAQVLNGARLTFATKKNEKVALKRW